jgi:hypothetical protein
MMRIETDDYIVRFMSGDDVKEKVFNALVEWYKKHEAFSGESICQSDGPTIDATNILSNIADDILAFDVEWKD